MNPRSPAASTTPILAVLFTAALMGGIAASAGVGAAGHRETFGPIGLVVVMMLLSFLLENRRPVSVTAQPGALSP